jgi:hypothetical protein
LASSVTVRRVQRAVQVVYQTVTNAFKRQTRPRRKTAKISEIIFSGLLPIRRAGGNGSAWARLTRRTSAHFFILAELELPRCWNSWHFSAIDGGKSHVMGAGARRLHGNQDLPTEIGAGPDRAARITDGKRVAR